MTLIQISNRLKVNYQNTISQTLFPHPFFFIIFSFLFFFSLFMLEIINATNHTPNNDDYYESQKESHIIK